MCFGGDGGAQQRADEQRNDENARKSRIQAGMSAIAGAFGGFDDGFYKKRAQNYVDYASPSVEKQAGDAHDQLIYALSRTGNLDSSAALKANADLTEKTNAERIGIANTGLDMANKDRSNIENVRGNIVAELNATGDSSAASASALRQTAGLNAPVGYSPIGNLFADFAAATSAIGARAGNGYSGFIPSKTNFAPQSGAQRVVR